MQFLYWFTAVAAFFAASVALNLDGLQRDTAEQHFAKARLSLADWSTWPSDHGDTSRSKFTIGAGLPKNFNPEELKVIQKSGLPLVQWIYTAGDFIYLIGGQSVKGSFIVKLDSNTLEVLQKFDLSPALYIGGMLIHKNGHVYCMHSNKLYAFWNGDLSNSTSFKLPSDLNANAIQTNGMLVTQDGNLVVKQWNLIIEDVLLMASATTIFHKIYAGCFVVLMTISLGIKYRQASKKEGKKASWLQMLFNSVMFSALGSAVIWIAIVVGCFQAILGPFDAFRYLTSNVLFYGAGGGELKIIDPLTLAVKASAKLTERCSFARMSMVAVQNEHGDDEDAITCLGDEFTYQFRWRPSNQQLYKIPKWSQRYRYRFDGSFPGTGPAIFNNVIYFTDNTFPVYLRNDTYSLFGTSIMHYPRARELTAEQKGRQNLEYEELYEDVPITTKDYQPIYETNREAMAIEKLSFTNRVLYCPPSLPMMKQIKLTTGGKPGFMFWSVVINPVVADILVWDTAGNTVQSRNAKDLSLHWKISNIYQGDCMSVAADKGHVYMTDYDKAPSYVNDWLGAVSGNIPLYTDARKFLIVADAATGAILANKTLTEVGEGIQASLIVPGRNNDILIGTSNGITRIYV